MRLYLSSYRTGNRPEELITLLGNGRRTAQINNAADIHNDIDRQRAVIQDADRLRLIGLEPEELDLRQYFGKPEILETVLTVFDLIWVRGGNAFVLRRAFRQSGADVVIPKLLGDNKVAYASASAGSVIVGSNLHGIELVDPPNEIPAGYDRPIVWEGLGLVPYSLVPHYKSDHPESVGIGKTVEYLIAEHMPFVALRDGETLVVNGDSQRIIG